MKNTIRWVMVFSAFAVAPLAAHASTILPYLECASVASGVSPVTEVSVSDVYGPIVAGQPRQPSIVANVSETANGDHQLLSQVSGIQESQSSAVGAPKYFDAQDFELEVRVDANDPRGVPAHLTVETLQGQRLSEDVYCHFLR